MVEMIKKYSIQCALKDGGPSEETQGGNQQTDFLRNDAGNENPRTTVLFISAIWMVLRNPFGCVLLCFG